jgi:hypothetical protein
MAERRMVKLWRYGSKQCAMSPRDDDPPFTVTVHDGENVIAQKTFDEHDGACAYAVGQLSIATASASS